MKLRIAQVAPLHESVPPRRYGGTERIVSYLTEELVRSGHEITLFASADSTTAAHLVPCCDGGLRDGGCGDPLPAHLAMIDEVARRSRAFDVIHFHLDYMHFPISAREEYSHLTTIHGRLDLPDVVPIYRRFPEMPLVSISHAQRAPFPFVGWRATVHHGLPAERYRLAPDRGRYLAFLGRISPEKRLDWAIEIAGRAGYPLRVAAKIDRADRDYFHETIEPLMRQPHVEYLGEIDDSEKQAFLGGALALVFPIDWPEPFGLVMIEAMACGTPVVAYRRGSVPEIIDPGITGFVCDDLESAVAAVARCAELSRERCRARFEQRFSVSRMAADYVTAYHQLVEHAHGARNQAAS